MDALTVETGKQSIEFSDSYFDKNWLEMKMRSQGDQTDLITVMRANPHQADEMILWLVKWRAQNRK